MQRQFCVLIARVLLANTLKQVCGGQCALDVSNSDYTQSEARAACLAHLGLEMQIQDVEESS